MVARPLTYGSVCSGVEAASLAWGPLGLQPAWFSEIEPFPSAVLAERWPDVSNEGDMTRLAERIRAGKLEAPDILAGGTPCQAFSIAGLKKSLEDDRGQLSLTYVDLLNAIDESRGPGHEAVCVWENVPGVLSTRDNAFGCFLAILCGEDAQPLEPDVRPASGKNSTRWRWDQKQGVHIPKWPRVGCVFGPQRAVAWRILDAQYFGVPQRRERLFVVASARKGFNPQEVLFEREGVRRDSAPSREEGEEATHPVAGSLTGSGRGVRTIGETRGQDPVVAVSPTLRAGGNSTGGDRPPGTDVDTCESLIIATHPSGAANTLTARMHKGVNSGLDEGQSLVVHGSQPACIHADSLGRSGEAVTPCPDAEGRVRLRPPGLGVIDDGNSYTLMAGAPHAVWVTGERSHSLRASHDASEDGTGRGTPVITVFSSKDSGQDAGPVSPTLRAMGSQSGHPNGGGQVAVAFEPGSIARNAGPSGESPLCPTLRASMGDNQPAVRVAQAVRRLMPAECERLQGFPDQHTLITYRGKHAADGPRYKAIGNSMAVPCMAYIGRRLREALA